MLLKHLAEHLAFSKDSISVLKQQDQAASIMGQSMDEPICSHLNGCLPVIFIWVLGEPQQKIDEANPSKWPEKLENQPPIHSWKKNPTLCASPSSRPTPSLCKLGPVGCRRPSKLTADWWGPRHFPESWHSIISGQGPRISEWLVTMVRHIGELTRKKKLFSRDQHINTC